MIQTRFVQEKQKESTCRRIGCFIYVSQLVKCSQTIHQVAGSFTSASTSFQPGEKLILKISFFLALQVSLKDVRKISTCPRWKTSTRMHGNNLTCNTNQRTIEDDFYCVLTQFFRNEDNRHNFIKTIKNFKWINQEVFRWPDALLIIQFLCKTR